MTVYLLHFDKPYKHARHYLGFTRNKDALTRFAEHGTAKGARLTRVAVENGVKLTLAAVWPGAPRSFERKLKNRADVAKWCPCCEQKNKLPEYKE